MVKNTIKKENKAGKKKEDVDLKVEGKVGKAGVALKGEKQEAGKVKVAAEKKVEPEKREAREGEAKVEKGVERKGKVATVKLEEKKEVITGEVAPLEEIISQVEKMTVLELSDLVKALEERFGVVAAAPIMAGAAPSDISGKEAVEKTEWSVVLTAVGEKKIQVIKEVRAVTSLGLKEAKTLVEEAPKPVKEGIPQKEAEEIKAKLEAVGATAELK